MAKAVGKFVPNLGSGEEIMLSRKCVAMVARIADELANSAAGAAGVIHGHSVVMRREDEPTPKRARSAIIVSHPTPKGRDAGNKALAALVKARRS
jgi:hypothetical protein